jgi:hypothetical protein
MANSLSVAGFPIDTLHVVHQDYARYSGPTENSDFERVSLGLACDGARQQQSGSYVIHFGTQYECRTSPSLLTASLGVERQPNEIAGIRHECCLHQDSSPWGGPQSVAW